MREKYKDRNHDYIVSLLRAANIHVKDTWQVSHGHPDLICEWRGFIFFVEIKSESGRLTPSQKLWIIKNRKKVNEDYFIIRNIEDVNFCLSSLCELK